MKKLNGQLVTQWVCPECGSNHVQQKAWVNLNGTQSIDWCASEDLNEFYCNDCDTNFSRIETIDKPCFNGKPRMIGFQVVSDDDMNDLHPEMQNNNVCSLSQAQKMINTKDNTWGYKLRAVYYGDIEGKVEKMFEGINPRI